MRSRAGVKLMRFTFLVSLLIIVIYSRVGNQDADYKQIIYEGKNYQQPKLPYHNMEVYGNASLGYYYTNIYLGSPPQKQSVIIDTGSGMLTVPCNKCKSCGDRHIDPYFDLTKTKTNKFLTCASKSPFCKSRCQGDVDGTQPCDFTISYAEGSSLTGIYLEDYVQLEDTTVGQQVKIDFGCTTTETNLFLKQQANGIFGLSPNRTEIIQKIFNQHSPKTGQKMIVSICLRTNGGYLSIGASQPKFHRKQPIRTQFMTGSNLYSLINVGNVSLGDIVFHHSNDNPGMYGIFVDSGSTYTYLPRQQYGIFISALDKLCGENKLCHAAKESSMRCYRLDTQESITPSQSQFQELINTIFKSIYFTINGSQLEWKPTEYFLLRDIVNREICSGISPLDRFLLGANWMVNKDIAMNIKQRTIQIYPQSVCSLNPEKIVRQDQQNDPKMGTVFQATQGNTPLGEISISRNILLNKTELLVILGTICLTVAVLVFACCICKKKQLRLPLQTNQEDEQHFNKNNEKSIVVNQQNQFGQEITLQMENPLLEVNMDS